MKNGKIKFYYKFGNQHSNLFTLKRELKTYATNMNFRLFENNYLIFKSFDFIVKFFILFDFNLLLVLESSFINAAHLYIHIPHLSQKLFLPDFLVSTIQLIVIFF